MRLALFALLLLAALAAGCSPAATTARPTWVVTGASTAIPATALPTEAATAVPKTPAPTTAPLVTRIEVTLTDTMRIEPAPMRVPVGVPVTFVVHNAGVIPHEFFLGDEAAQDEHEREMAGMGGMTHDEPGGVGLHGGETKELVFTFTDAGATLAGCHVPGHYAAGMKAQISVE